MNKSNSLKKLEDYVNANLDKLAIKAPLQIPVGAILQGSSEETKLQVVPPNKPVVPDVRSLSKAELAPAEFEQITNLSLQLEGFPTICCLCLESIGDTLCMQLDCVAIRHKAHNHCVVQKDSEEYVYFKCCFCEEQAKPITSREREYAFNNLTRK